jgi:hypothetical protein
MHAEEYDILDFSSRVLGSGRLPPADLNPFGLSLQPNLVNENIRPQLRRGSPPFLQSLGLRFFPAEWWLCVVWFVETMLQLARLVSPGKCRVGFTI